MGCGASGLKTASERKPPPSFTELVAEGKVVPDEHDGPYALRSFHANVDGEWRGFKSKLGRDYWLDTNDARLSHEASWAKVDFQSGDAADPEYLFSHGLIDGVGVDMQELRPAVVEAQAAMKAGYDQAFEAALSKPGAAEAH